MEPEEEAEEAEEEEEGGGGEEEEDNGCHGAEENGEEKKWQLAEAGGGGEAEAWKDLEGSRRDRGGIEEYSTSTLVATHRGIRSGNRDSVLVSRHALASLASVRCFAFYTGAERDLVVRFADAPPTVPDRSLFLPPRRSRLRSLGPGQGCRAATPRRVTSRSHVLRGP